MDGTTQALLFALLGAVLGAGVVLAWQVSERQMHSQAPVEEPVVPAGIATVLGVLRSSALVVDEKDEVVKASAPAYSFGLVSGDRVTVEELADLIRLFTDLSNSYQKVEIKYTFAEPANDETNKITTIKGKTEVNITPEQLTELTEKVTAVRDYIIK